MLILGTGDHHFNLNSRWAECVRVHQWLVREVRERKPDLFLSGGDLYHAESTPQERRCVANWLKAIADVCPVVLTKGNHDPPLDCHLMGRLAAQHAIIVEEGSRVEDIDLHESVAAIATVAWPDRASLANITGRPLSAEEVDNIGGDALRNLFRGFGEQWDGFDGPKILLGHFMIDGSKTGTGQPLIGKEMHIGLSDLALAKPSIVFASHIHKAQEFEYDGIPIVLPGSLYRRDFGEMEEKSYVLAEFDGSRLVDWERIASPCRPMVLVNGKYDYAAGMEYPQLMIKMPGWEDWGIGGLPGYGGSLIDADVRLRYTVEADKRDAARKAADEWKRLALEMGKAAHVQVDPEIKTEIHARAPEIAAAHTLEDKLRAYWAASGAGIDADRESRLLNLLPELQKGKQDEIRS